MSRILTPRNIGLAVVGAGAGYIILKRTGGTPMQTPAVQSIGDRWSSGGGTNVHTPGIATRRGSSEHTLEPQQDPKGIPSNHFKENVADQKAQQPGAAGKMWNETHYGHEKGK